MIKTVGELISELSEFDEDTPIVINENGRGATYTPIKEIYKEYANEEEMEEEDPFEDTAPAAWVEILVGSNGYSASQVNSLIKESKEDPTTGLLSEVENVLDNKGK